MKTLFIYDEWNYTIVCNHLMLNLLVSLSLNTSVNIILMLHNYNKLKPITSHLEMPESQKLSMEHGLLKSYCSFIQLPKQRWRSPLSKQEHIDGHEPSDKTDFNSWIWLQGPFKRRGQLFMRLKTKHLFSWIITFLSIKESLTQQKGVRLNFESSGLSKQFDKLNCTINLSI